MEPPDGRWRVVRSALQSWSRTTRLCVIILIAGVPMDALTWTILR
ncbi:MAG: hypothetical protein QOI89_3886 [Solirubrobacteraceae bacterium]|jgi:hypothetical protein|nr:hypothetical protein [Solirubrobacteraceae bacterium]